MICLPTPTAPLTPSIATQINSKVSCSSLHLRPPNYNSNIEGKVVPFRKTHVLKLSLYHSQKPKTKLCALAPNKSVSGDGGRGGERSHEEIGLRMWALCGFGFWVQGFRCFPWLALNFHMAHGLRMSPSGLQLVQNACNLPMVAKPLFGVLSYAVYIGGAHRLPYISIGVLFSRLCPPGCEGSLFAFFASALCLSSILSGILGIGLASLLGVSSGDYSSLPLGIILQIAAALLPLGWISHEEFGDE